MSKPPISYCTNCGEYNHATKQCTLPITSYGTILFRIKGEWDQVPKLLQSDTSINGLEGSTNSNIEYLLIQRRDSLGYIDIMRGKYRLDDVDYISQQIRGMTRDEQQRLISVPFDTLWEQLWGPPTEGSNPYKNEKENSRAKLLAIRSSSPSLSEIIESVNTFWPTPEWGFPKGRRDPHESEYACAVREMKEETGLVDGDFIPIKNLDMLKETFFGSNHVQYCHKYFIMYVCNNNDIKINRNNIHMSREIGDIRWCSLDEAQRLIRSDNVEKREILLRSSSLLRNYCPFRFGP